MPSTPYAIIQGVGPGTGSSIAKTFAQKYPVILLARSAGSYEPLAQEIERSGGKAVGIGMDVTSADSVRSAFDQIKALGDGEGSAITCAAAVMNGAGAFARKPFLDVTHEEFETGSLKAAEGAFLFAQAVLPLLLEHAAAPGAHPPTLIFTGATASVKGSALFASFAAGKWATRGLAQSLAREFGPRGVHVAHAVIDGVIDIPRTKEWKFDAPDAKIDPDAVGALPWFLARRRELRTASATHPSWLGTSQWLK